ncbi:MAG: HAMP domain-containing histidine kinase [Paludibacteraceae bacterium]|nr:HAMP domain-containing histidine kinase [Paludibacteraceae bacterium]
MVNIYNSQNTFRVAFVVISVLIVLSSVWVSYRLIADLSKEEDMKMELWAMAVTAIGSSDESMDFSVTAEVVSRNTTIPVLLTDTLFTVLSYKNLPKEDYTPLELTNLAKKYAKTNAPIRIDVGKGNSQFVCYDDSVLLKALTYYPIVLSTVLVVFFVLILVILYITKKAEQNKVWVGLSKETAHQLGTPISSLLAWTEILRQNYPHDVMLPEMEKDVNRLRIIADRFSQIGSVAELEVTELNPVIERTVMYMRKRISRQITLLFEATGTYSAQLNVPLFEWVIENLCKNAVDAMVDDGTIRIFMTAKDNLIYIDVTDTGKGISKHHINQVFRPGFTTKKRGWGLGLSLAYRIIHEYHKGKIFVRYSEVNVGTTFRIELQKA